VRVRVRYLISAMRRPEGVPAYEHKNAIASNYLIIIMQDILKKEDYEYCLTIKYGWLSMGD